MIKSLPMLIIVTMCCVNEKGEVNLDLCKLNKTYFRDSIKNNQTTFIDTRINIVKEKNRTCLLNQSIWYTPSLEYSSLKDLNYSNTIQTLIIIDYILIENETQYIK